MKKQSSQYWQNENTFQISFESFGVKIGVRADSPNLLSALESELDKINPHGFEIIDNAQAEHLFEIKTEKTEKTEKTKNSERNEENEIFVITKAGELLWAERKPFLAFLQSQIRITIAEYAESRVFLHAGAVGWKGKAIIIPAKSFSGKSSLVAELVKRGALYYSDDFAVLDGEGLLHPFHRQLSLRKDSEDKYKQIDFSVESLGGSAGYEPLPVGLVLITEYNEDTKTPEIWKPEILSGGRGVMEILSHTIPIRYNPKFSLEVLNKVAGCAIICKSQRGEAKKFADLLLNFFEIQVIK